MSSGPTASDLHSDVVHEIMTGPTPMSAEAQQRADEIASQPRKPLPVTNTPKESILGEAHRLVMGDRRSSYGHPLDNHGASAEMFAVYVERKYGIRIPFDAEDTCWFEILQRATRDAQAEGRDYIVDTAGYAFNIELIRAERDRREAGEIQEPDWTPGGTPMGI